MNSSLTATELAAYCMKEHDLPGPAGVINDAARARRTGNLVPTSHSPLAAEGAKLVGSGSLLYRLESPAGASLQGAAARLGLGADQANCRAVA